MIARLIREAQSAGLRLGTYTAIDGRKSTVRLLVLPSSPDNPPTSGARALTRQLRENEIAVLAALSATA